MVSAPQKILGIDLGTHFSSAAVVVGGKLRMIPDERGEVCIPSVVHLPKQGRPSAGSDADRQRMTDPANTVWGVKRILGRPFDSPSSRLFQASSACKIARAPDGDCEIQANGRNYSPSEIASVILRYLKDRAEVAYGAGVKQAIITLPVSSTPKSRAATILAAKMAGLEVIETLPEPTAAAVAIGLDRYKGERKFAVYDFGGGTFDVTIMTQNADRFEVLATGGDECLGGDNLDDALTQLVAGQVFTSHRVDILKDATRRDRLQRQCEQVKRALSASADARLRLDQAFSAQGRWHNLDSKITREMANQRWLDFVERSIKITAETLIQAGLRPADLSGIALVGGTTYVPLVRDRVSQVLKRPTAHEGDPQTAVALGAALVAARGAKLIQEIPAKADPLHTTPSQKAVGMGVERSR